MFTRKRLKLRGSAMTSTWCICDYLRLF